MVSCSTSRIFQDLPGVLTTPAEGQAFCTRTPWHRAAPAKLVDAGRRWDSRCFCSSHGAVDHHLHNANTARAMQMSQPPRVLRPPTRRGMPPVVSGDWLYSWHKKPSQTLARRNCTLAPSTSSSSSRTFQARLRRFRPPSPPPSSSSRNRSRKALAPRCSLSRPVRARRRGAVAASTGVPGSSQRPKEGKPPVHEGDLPLGRRHLHQCLEPRKRTAPARPPLLLLDSRAAFGALVGSRCLIRSASST